MGLLQAAYTLTGYGMVASLSEEVQNPEREVPKAMVLSVAAAGVTVGVFFVLPVELLANVDLKGVIYLIPVLFVMPDIQELLAAPLGQPMPVLFKEITGSAGGGLGLLILLLGICLCSGIGSLTATCESLSSRPVLAHAKLLLEQAGPHGHSLAMAPSLSLDCGPRSTKHMMCH